MGYFRIGGGFAMCGGQMVHRPPWKVAINAVLRALQPWTLRKFVVITKVEWPGRSDQLPRVVGYGFGRVLHRW